jgi:hypothetical protein
MLALFHLGVQKFQTPRSTLQRNTKSQTPKIQKIPKSQNFQKNYDAAGSGWYSAQLTE